MSDHPLWRRLSITALVVSLGLLSACGTNPSVPSASPSRTVAATPASDPPVPQPSPLTWGTCPASVGSDDLQCARLQVPLDYSKPTGTKITLELSRKLHSPSAGQYLGAILVNPGGPGASGLPYADLSYNVPGGVGDRFDWIGWDPRGVGASTPSIHCEPGYFGTDRPPYNAPAERSFWLKKAAGYAAACGKDAGALLAHMTTADNARDMDVIRQALGLSKISYYGFSWGSYLGQVYLSLFPTHVSRIVLDGVVDPRRPWYGANLDQDAAFQKTIEIFFGWVARNDSVYHLGTTEQAVYGAYSRELAKLTKSPAGGGAIGPDEFNDAMLQAGYYVFNWPQNATAMAELINDNDASGILKAYQDNNQGAANENNYAVYDAVQCSDVAWPGWAKTLADTERLNRTAPFETWGNSWYNAPCLTWPTAPHTLVPIRASAGLPKILLIAETYDAATPFAGALEVRRRFPTASLIEGVDGSTHASSLKGVSCTDDAVANYLATGQTPTRVSGNRSDLKCPPYPQPKAAWQN